MLPDISKLPMPAIDQYNRPIFRSIRPNGLLYRSIKLVYRPIRSNRPNSISTGKTNFWIIALLALFTTDYQIIAFLEQSACKRSEQLIKVFLMPAHKYYTVIIALQFYAHFLTEIIHLKKHKNVNPELFLRKSIKQHKRKLWKLPVLSVINQNAYINSDVSQNSL